MRELVAAVRTQSLARFLTVLEMPPSSHLIYVTRDADHSFYRTKFEKMLDFGHALRE